MRDALRCVQTLKTLWVPQHLATLFAQRDDLAGHLLLSGHADLKDLLSFLASHPRRVFSREQLMDRLWGYSAALDTGTVTVHVRRLREKVEDDPSRPEHLQTVWGVGYRVVP